MSDKTKADLEEFKNIIEGQKQMLSGHGLSKKVRAFVDQIDYWGHLIADNPKSEKAARYKMHNIESLINSMDIWENNPDNTDTSLYTYLNRITLLSRDDMENDTNKGTVNLMTIHASKGLEFPVVFIAGVEEGIIPHQRSIEEEREEAIEEERRLFYVAVTRARNRLILSSCQHRRRMQAQIDATPSRFLDEIPANLVQYHEPPKEVDSQTAHNILEEMKKKFGM